jgi:AraC family transcriptional regulator of adaptative response/methylated-DNA-[protein]-cysteine methyltransferase
MQITFTTTDSPLGRLLVAATPKGICMVSAGDSDRELERRMHDRFPKTPIQRDDAAMRRHVAAVSKLVNGKTDADSLSLDLQGTPFQKKVWAELLRIPAGQTRSYGEIARRVKHPTAYRAVANACGANPVAVVVPCHRVIASDGSIGGYGLGLDRKRRLLANEGHHLGGA